MKILVLKSEMGKVTSEQIVDGELGETVRKVATEALKEWNEYTSDFIIMKDVQEIKIPLPLKPETYDALKNFLAGKEKNAAIARVPFYIISFENEWQENDFMDKRVYVVTYYINDDMKKEAIDYAASVTSQERGSVEGLEEEEEE